jgi:Protein of unknown function (DUF4232)
MTQRVYQRRFMVALTVAGCLLASGWSAGAATTSGRRHANTVAKVMPCTSASLQVALGPTQGAAGQNVTPVIFTNHSTATCSISGVPSLQAGVGLGAAFQPRGPLARNLSMGQMGVLFRLAPGASVATDYGSADTLFYTPSTCRSAATTSLEVTFGTYWHGVLTHADRVCTAVASTTTQLLHAGRS